MTAAQDTRDVQRDIERLGVPISFEDAQTLRRAQLTLHRWAEGECGTSNEYNSWCIERDEDTNIPYLAIYPSRGASYRRRIADREAGALRRVAAVCARNGLTFYHQGDPRGRALYVGTEPLADSNYSSRGVAV